jgi:hypothetical protein
MVLHVSTTPRIGQLPIRPENMGIPQTGCFYVTEANTFRLSLSQVQLQPAEIPYEAYTAC